ncbi:hypothetical protein PG987_005001 [Apiospora arundinis]
MDLGKTLRYQTSLSILSKGPLISNAPPLTTTIQGSELASSTFAPMTFEGQTLEGRRTFKDDIASGIQTGRSTDDHDQLGARRRFFFSVFALTARASLRSMETFHARV